MAFGRFKAGLGNIFRRVISIFADEEQEPTDISEVIEQVFEDIEDEGGEVSPIPWFRDDIVDELDNIPNENLIPKGLMTPATGWNLSDCFLYMVEIRGLDRRSGGTPVVITRSVSSSEQLSFDTVIAEAVSRASTDISDTDDIQVEDARVVEASFDPDCV